MRTVQHLAGVDCGESLTHSADHLCSSGRRSTAGPRSPPQPPRRCARRPNSCGTACRDRRNRDLHSENRQGEAPKGPGPGTDKDVNATERADERPKSRRGLSEESNVERRTHPPRRRSWWSQSTWHRRGTCLLRSQRRLLCRQFRRCCMSDTASMTGRRSLGRSPGHW